MRERSFAKAVFESTSVFTFIFRIVTPAWRFLFSVSFFFEGLNFARQRGGNAGVGGGGLERGALVSQDGKKRGGKRGIAKS